MAVKIKEYFKDWYRFINTEELNKITKVIMPLHNKGVLCPDINNVFKWLQVTPLEELKIVMISSEPYNKKNKASGILFGCNEIYTGLYEELEILKEAAIDYELNHSGIIFDNSLESWCKQGVLMMPISVTSCINTKMNHVLLWRCFITDFIRKLSNDYTGIIYVLLGNEAKSLKYLINKTNNYILEEEHPSYYVKYNKRMSSKLFYDINKITNSLYGTSINWYQNINQ